ncbi:hypothetical protein TWF694_011553 [Orbilia ellipsospora]|uniref:Terpene synthase n=1 Tax=Orbilia ellipsospora TaxID=2528407 RepID=A0AAV9X5U4_9PEZI
MVTGNLFLVQLYIWDDEMDSPIYSDLPSNLQAADRFRHRTIKHLEKYLGSETPKDIYPNKFYNNQERENEPLRPELERAIASFDSAGEALAPVLSKGERELFYRELISSIALTRSEQRTEQCGNAPTIEEYIAIRTWTSAVKPVSALSEYMHEIQLGDIVRSDPDVKAIFEENAILVYLANDMFSLRRELTFPFYCNAVAVLYHKHQNLQTAVDGVYSLIRESFQRFEEAAKRLFDRYPEKRDILEMFIDGARVMVTGNITWSKKIRRYKLGIEKFDGTTSITI